MGEQDEVELLGAQLTEAADQVRRRVGRPGVHDERRARALAEPAADETPVALEAGLVEVDELESGEHLASGRCGQRGVG